MTSPFAQLMADEVEELEFRILIPILYSRFVQYSDTMDALLSECYQSATVSISKPDVLSSLAFPALIPPIQFKPADSWEALRFTMQYLRKRSSRIINTVKKGLCQASRGEGVKENATTFSGLDNFIVAEGTREDRREYTAKLGKLFITEYVAFGWVEILDLQIFLVRCVVAWILAGKLV